jgi:hypothetical protein
MLKAAHILELFAHIELTGVPVPAFLSTQKALQQAASLWATILADLSPDDLKRAFAAWSRTHDQRFWPTPGQLHALARPPAEDHADADWGALCTAVVRYGSYNPPATSERQGTWTLHTDDRRRAAMEAGVAAIGGWSMLCATLRTDDDNAPMRASFRVAYREQRRQVAAAVEAETIRQILAGGGIDLGHLLPGPAPAPAAPQLVAVGGVMLTPEERAEKMRAHERRMAEAKAQARERGRRSEDA